eukprot:gene6026-7240_t
MAQFNWPQDNGATHSCDSSGEGSEPPYIYIPEAWPAQAWGSFVNVVTAVAGTATMLTSAQFIAHYRLADTPRLLQFPRLQLVLFYQALPGTAQAAGFVLAHASHQPEPVVAAAFVLALLLASCAALGALLYQAFQKQYGVLFESLAPLPPGAVPGALRAMYLPVRMGARWATGLSLGVFVRAVPCCYDPEPSGAAALQLSLLLLLLGLQVLWLHTTRPVEDTGIMRLVLLGAVCEFLTICWTVLLVLGVSEAGWAIVVTQA